MFSSLQAEVLVGHHNLSYIHSIYSTLTLRHFDQTRAIIDDEVAFFKKFGCTLDNPSEAVLSLYSHLDVLSRPWHLQDAADNGGLPLPLPRIRSSYQASVI